MLPEVFMKPSIATQSKLVIALVRLFQDTTSKYLIQTAQMKSSVTVSLGRTAPWRPNVKLKTLSARQQSKDWTPTLKPLM